MPYKVLVRADEGDISVILSNTRLIGTASANPAPNMGEGAWWVCRVLVQKPHRGRGIGQFLVANLAQTARKLGAKKLVVCPGGYDSAYEDQARFYEHCGFKLVEEGMYSLDLEQKDGEAEKGVFRYEDITEEDIRNRLQPPMDVQERVS